MDVGFADRRGDVLLPVEDPRIRASLRLLVPRIFEALARGAAVLPLLGGEGEGEGEGEGAEGEEGEERRGGDALGDLDELELIECAALIAEPGCEHQGAHADYRRFVAKGEVPKSARLPPRLVAFLYLQDTPSAEWGATHFLPGTSTAQAHSRFFEAGETGQAEVRSATLSCGDVALYDASVLHFGGANRVPGNTRVIWYIGAARKGEAARLAAGSATATPGLQAVPPIPLKSFL